MHALVDVEKCTRVRLGDRQDTTSEGTEGQSTTDSNTQGHFATLVPDPCTETCKQTHALESCTAEPKPATLRSVESADAQGARALSADDEMETASETTSDGDTEGDTASETTGERAVEDIVRERVNTGKYTTHVLSLLRDKQRNKTFVNIVGYLIEGGTESQSWCAVLTTLF